MSILIDFHPVMISNAMQQIKHNSDLQEDLIRHMVLTSLLGYKRKFQDQYGKLVICCDGKNCWRKSSFKYYKAGRKKTRDASALDWHMMFDILNKVKSELKEHFPYKFIQVDGAEADDVIYVMCKNKNILEKSLIVSSDKDMKQLLKFNNVDFYSIYHKTMLDVENPTKFLKEHILTGDPGDGVPNFLSDDDAFENKEKRQKQLRKTKIEEYMSMNPTDFKDDKLRRNYDRNRLMIDLDCIPENVQSNILNECNTVAVSDGKNLFDYFMKNRLKLLMEDLPEFLR